MDVRLSAGIFRRVVTAHYFDFHGRAGRAEFWNYAFVFLAVSLSVGLIVRFAPLSPLRILFTCWFLACFLPTVGVTIRRLHDLGRTGWWLVTPVLPAFIMLLFFSWFAPLTTVLAATTLGSTAWLVYLCLQPGMRGENRYGPGPEPLFA